MSERFGISAGGVKFAPLIFGEGLAAYSLALSFHKCFGVDSYVFGKPGEKICIGSSFIHFRSAEDMDSPEEIAFMADTVQEEHPGEKLLMAGCSANYADGLIRAGQYFGPDMVCAYTDEAVFRRFSDKESFFRMCADEGLNVPEFAAVGGNDFSAVSFTGPYVLRAADEAEYLRHPFRRMERMYHAGDLRQAAKQAAALRKGGYGGPVLVQKYIPSKDRDHYTITAYSDRSGKVLMMTPGRVFLQDPDPKEKGEPSVICSVENPGLCEQMRGLLEKQAYKGFCCIDLIQDQASGKYYIIDFRCHHTSSLYFSQLCGAEPARYLAVDLLDGKADGAEYEKKECVFVSVPWQVVEKQLAAEDLAMISELRQQGKLEHPLYYDGEDAPDRQKMMLKTHLEEIVKYRMKKK